MSVKLKRLFILFIAVFMLSADAGLSFAVPHNDHQNESAQAQYYCPMHPQVVSDKPGNCPICHMRLVKRDSAKEAAAHLAAGASGDGALPKGYSIVPISPARQQLIGIRTATVVSGQIKQLLSVPARVAYDPELYEAQINYLQEYRTAQGTLRARELTFKNLSTTRWEAPRIEQAKSKLMLMGMDEESIRQLVENAKADEALLYLQPKGDTLVYAEVFEMDTHKLRKDNRVLLEVPGTGKTHEARLHSIGSFVDPETRRVHAHVALKNDGTLRPGMLLNATIETQIAEGLTVPEEAVFLTGSAAIVFVEKTDGIYEPRAVKTGAGGGDMVQIIEGLHEGEKIVVNGNFLLDSESRLKASLDQAGAVHAGHGGES